MSHRNAMNFFFILWWVGASFSMAAGFCDEEVSGGTPS